MISVWVGWFQAFFSMIIEKVTVIEQKINEQIFYKIPEYSCNPADCKKCNAVQWGAGEGISNFKLINFKKLNVLVKIDSRKKRSSPSVRNPGRKALRRANGNQIWG